jgi:hypothetical protein
VVNLEPELASPADYTIQSQRLSPQSQPPFAADLMFDQVQWVWEIDLETNLLVSQSLFALTVPEPTLIYSKKLSQPQVMILADLPPAWDALPTDAILVSLAGDNPHDASASLETAVQALTFPIYLPTESALLDHDFSLTPQHVVYSNDTAISNPTPLAFELTQVGETESGLQVIYQVQPIVDPNHPQVLVLIQAPRTEIVPKLQQSLPVWSRSHSTNVNLSGETFTGWVVSGGLLREGDNNPLIGLIFETDETLFSVQGQNLSENVLLQFVSQLQPMNNER